MNGKGLHVAIIQEVDVAELFSANLSGAFLAGSGCETNLLQTGSSTGTMNTPQGLTQVTG